MIIRALLTFPIQPSNKAPSKRIFQFHSIGISLSFPRFSQSQLKSFAYSITLIILRNKFSLNLLNLSPASRIQPLL
mgnify:CR=1 FL=1